MRVGESRGCQGKLGRWAAWCGAGSGSCSCALLSVHQVSELSRVTEISWWLRHSLHIWEVIQSVKPMGFHLQRHSQNCPKRKDFYFQLNGTPDSARNTFILFFFSGKKIQSSCRCWAFLGFLLTFWLQHLNKVDSLFTCPWSNAGALL